MVLLFWARGRTLRKSSQDYQNKNSYKHARNSILGTQRLAEETRKSSKDENAKLCGLTAKTILKLLFSNRRWILTLFRMGFFGAAHRWKAGWRGGGGWPKSPPPTKKSLTHILQWWNLPEFYLSQKKFKKYMNHVTNSLSSADISIFLSEISKFCYIKK